MRLADTLCFVLGLGFLEGIFCLLPSFVEEVHDDNQLPSEFGDVGYLIEGFLSPD